MTVLTEEASTSFLPGNGLATTWPFGFPVYATAQVKLERRTAGGDILVIPTDRYTVDLQQDGRLGGSVAYPIDGSLVPEGEAVRVSRKPDWVQAVQLRNQSGYNPDVVERMADLALYRAQFLRDVVARMPQPPWDVTISSWDRPVQDYYARAYRKADGSWGIAWNVGTDANTAATRELGFLSAQSIGLALDGVTDDSLKLNDAMKALSAAGGGTVVLASKTGGSLYYAHDISIPTGVNLVWSVPGKRAPGAKIKMAGGRKHREGADQFRLVSDAAAGASTITVDTAPHGGGALSSFFGVGQMIVIEGLRDASGKPLEREESIVTALDDGARTLTLLRPLAHAYKAVYPTGEYELTTGSVNTGRIAIPRQAGIVGDAAAGAAVVTLTANESADVGLQDWVLIADERRTGSGVATHVEIAQVVAVGEAGPSTITLNRKLRRGYLTAQYAKVSVLAPVRRASCQGASVTNTATPGADIGSVFNVSFALDCTFYDCEHVNTDLFGTRDAAFRFDYSYNCAFVRPSARNSRYLSEGEGNGVVFACSTRCVADAPALSGCRHAVQYVCATECGASEVETDDCRLTDVDFHGCNSVGSWATLRNVSYGGKTASSSNGAIIFGNPTHQAGDHECWVAAGEVGPFAGSSGAYAVQIVPPSTRCWVLNTRFRDIHKLLIVRDVPGAASLVARDCGLQNIEVDGCAHNLIDVAGNLNGSTTKILDGLYLLGVTGRALKRGLNLRQMANLVIDGCALIADASPDGTAKYAIYQNDVTGLRVRNSTLRGFLRGVQSAACPGHRYSRVDLEEVGEGVVLDDVSGNTGAEWRYCDFPGAASPSVTGTPVIAHWPVPVGGDFVTTA